MTLSAPTISTVWALGDPWQREQIEQAHGRHRADHPPPATGAGRAPALWPAVVEEHAKDVIATEYRHTTARGVAERDPSARPAAAQPHRYHRRCP